MYCYEDSIINSILHSRYAKVWKQDSINTDDVFYEMFDFYCIQQIYRNWIVVTSSTFLHSLSYRLNAIWLEGITSKVNLFDACWNVLLKKLYPRYLMTESFSFYYDCHHKISYNHMFKPRKSYTIQKLFHI